MDPKLLNTVKVSAFFRCGVHRIRAVGAVGSVSCCYQDCPCRETPFGGSLYE